MRIFCGNANPDLANKICDYMEVPLGNAEVKPFPDGETHVRIYDDVRGQDCFVIQPTCVPVNDNLMELLVFIDSLHRASARRITAVLPYYGYARQDRKSQGRTPITAKLVANMLTAAKCDRVLAIDLHAEQIQGFFDIPLDHLTAVPVISSYFQAMELENMVIVSPDVGNMKTANVYAKTLGGDMAVIDKHRKSGTEVEMGHIIGDVCGKDVLMFDDMISTAGTICTAAEVVKSHGANSVRVAATHGVFAGPAVERLKQSVIDEVVVTDTITMREDVKSIEKLKVLSVAELIGEAIDRIHHDKSVSAIFKKYKLMR